MEHTEIALPNGRYSVKDSHEQDALRQNTWRKEVHVSLRAGRKSADLSHDFAKQHEPEDGLDRPAQQLPGIVPQLADFRVSDGHDVGSVISRPINEGFAGIRA